MAPTRRGSTATTPGPCRWCRRNKGTCHAGCLRRDYETYRQRVRGSDMSIRGLKVAFAALTALAVLSWPASAQTPRKVNVIIDLLNMAYTPLFVAITNGIFARHGLEINVTTLQSGSTIAAVVQSGSIDFAA